MGLALRSFNGIVRHSAQKALQNTINRTPVAYTFGMLQSLVGPQGFTHHFCLSEMSDKDIGGLLIPPQPSWVSCIW